jgi:hypothetical protein
MATRPRKCGAQLPDGSLCEELARTLSVRFFYGIRPAKDGSLERYLSEAHYHLHCPKCGAQKQITTEEPAE